MGSSWSSRLTPSKQLPILHCCAAPALAALRAILEEVLLNVMYDVPSRDDIAQVIITAEVVRDSVLPTLVPREKLAKRERREKSA